MHKLINQATNILAHTPNPHTTTTSTSSGSAGLLWHQWKNQPFPFTQDPQQTSLLWRIYFQRKHTSSCIRSHQPYHKRLRPNSLLTRTPHHLYNTTLKPRHMQPHTLNQHKTVMLQFYPQYPEMQHNLIKKHYFYQPIKTCLHTHISWHNHHKTWQQQKNTEFTTQDW